MTELNTNHKTKIINTINKILDEGRIPIGQQTQITHVSMGGNKGKFCLNKDLKKKFPKTYFAQLNKVGYNLLKLKFNSQKKKNYLELYLLLIYGFNRMLRFNGSGEFNLPVGNVDFNSNVVDSLKSYLEITSKMTIDFHSLDFKEYLKIVKPIKGDFVYLDPPYLITGSEYNKLWNDDLETELYNLVDKLDAKGVKFMLSNVVEYNGKTNEALSLWSKKYRVIEISSNYINFNDNGKKKMREILVVNYA
jgi:DNA adenine methylase